MSRRRTCATKGSTIRYTTDGTDPTGASPVYHAPITLTSTGLVVKAQAFARILEAPSLTTFK